MRSSGPKKCPSWEFEFEFEKAHLMAFSPTPHRLELVVPAAASTASRRSYMPYTQSIETIQLRSSGLYQVCVVGMRWIALKKCVRDQYAPTELGAVPDKSCDSYTS